MRDHVREVIADLDGVPDPALLGDQIALVPQGVSALTVTGPAATARITVETLIDTAISS